MAASPHRGKFSAEDGELAHSMFHILFSSIFHAMRLSNGIVIIISIISTPSSQVLTDAGTSGELASTAQRRADCTMFICLVQSGRVLRRL